MTLAAGILIAFIALILIVWGVTRADEPIEIDEQAHHEVEQEIAEQKKRRWRFWSRK